MTDELHELSEINPVRPEDLAAAVMIDPDDLRTAFEADEEPARIGSLTRLPSGPMARVGYVGAGLLVAAGFAAVAVAGLGDLTEDVAITDPGAAPGSDQDQDRPPLVAVTPTTRESDSSSATASMDGAAEDTDGEAPSSSGEATPDSGSPSTPKAASGLCQAGGSTQQEAASAYGETCTQPRVDCDEFDDGWVCSSEVLGQSAPTRQPSSDPSTERPILDSPFDPANDVLSLHYDHAPNRDDGLSSMAAREIATWLDVEPHVVGGTYGTNRAQYNRASEPVMDAAWGVGNWVNANEDRDRAVRLTANRWLATIDRGGSIWVAEGGQSDFTASVVRELRRRRPALNTTAVVNVVQHSGSNETKTTAEDFEYVRAQTSYQKIDDGNLRNDTADLKVQSPEFVTAARSGRHADGWEQAFEYQDPEELLDFSDTVAVLHIIGVGIDQVAEPAEFAEFFIR